MAGDLNQVTLIGRLGKDPEIKSFDSGDKVANFSIATSEAWKDKSSGEKKERTEWTNVVVWGPLADVVEKYVSKGDKIFVQGKLQTRKWEKDGVDRYTTEVVLRGFDAKLLLLGSKSDGERKGGGSGGGEGAQGSSYDSGIDDDSIPF